MKYLMGEAKLSLLGRPKCLLVLESKNFDESKETMLSGLSSRVDQIALLITPQEHTGLAPCIHRK
jgi:hypothetical protein